jgi:mannosyltransferase OCH1-like enzyme
MQLRTRLKHRLAEKKYFCIVILAALCVILLWPRRSPRDPKLVADETLPMRETSSLPKIIHQCWKDDLPLPLHFKTWTDKLKATFPNHTYILWTDEKLRDFIATKYSWFLQYYDSLPMPVMKVDAARCFILYEYGGLYVDMDYEVMEDFWLRLPDDVPAVVESPWFFFLEKTQNSFMSSPKKSAFWQVTWDVMIDRIKEGVGRNPVYATGPQAIDEAIRRYTGTVVILPCENWQRPALGNAGGYAGFKHTFVREVGNRLGLLRSCGDVKNPYYQFGIHHQTTIWD